MLFNKSFRLVILLAFLGFSCACGKKDDGGKSSEPESADLLVCTFNIRYASAADGDNSWDNRKAAVVKFIQTRQPDVIGMQEVEKTQAVYLKNQVGSDYEIYGIGRESGKDIFNADGTETTSAILYKKSRFTLATKGKFWHDDGAPQSPPAKDGGRYGSWKTSHPLITTWMQLQDKNFNGRSLWVFDTHYQNNKNMEGQGPQIRLLESRLHKSQMSAIVGEAIGAGCQTPVILFGDFNATSDSSELQELINVPMGYTRLDAAKSSTRYNNTCNDFGSGGSLIDHTFFSGPLKAIEYRADARSYGVAYISDHYPVLSSFAYTK
ncbi:MAG: endonuclease/exonuclease/phosphatase family protein [Bacteroidales bacterium]|nr:endonuclease/exonuclease/phosphatase family protein [Bacteroidales bacterium]